MPESEAVASLRELEPEIEEGDEDNDELEWEESKSEYYGEEDEDEF